MSKFLKSELKEFVINKQSEKAEEVRQEKLKAIKAANTKAHEKQLKIFMEQKVKLEEIINNLRDTNDSLKAISWYHSPLQSAFEYLCNALGNLNLDNPLRNLDFEGRDQIESKYGKKLKDVNDEFNKVLSIVQAKTPKQAAVFLTELGYDISHLDHSTDMPEVALVAEINTDLLGI